MGCSDLNSPSISSYPSVQQTVAGGVSSSTLISNILTGVTLQKLPKARTRIPQVTVTQTVNSKTGGILTANFSYVSVWRKTVNISASLAIPPNALKQSQQITMTFDTANCAVQFEPEGLVFNKPAVLAYSASNVALIGLNLSFWYDDDMGHFTLLPSDISISLSLGCFQATNCQVPHFSRYAFGR